MDRGSLCSVYWQMAMIMSAVSSSYTSTSVDGRPEDYLDCYRRLDVAFEQTHVEEAEFHLRDISDQIREIRERFTRPRWLRHSSVTFSPGCASFIRDEEKFQVVARHQACSGKEAGVVSNDP